MSVFSRFRTVALALLLVPAIAFGQAATIATPAVLAASGLGEARVTPDRASVLVNVQTRSATATAAAADNAAKSTAVLNALGRLGLSRDQLSTEGYSVYPEMKYEPNGTASKVVAYVVTNSIRAETKRTDQAGAIIDAALAAGANMVNNLSFYASSIDEARRQAIGAAVASARADAEAMARAAGGTLGILIDLSTSGPTMPPRPMYEMAMRKSIADQTPINPGQQTVAVSVSARWQFVPGR